jgi:hypothetical protein
MAELTRRPLRSSPQLDLGVAVSRLSGSSGLTEMHKTFARRHALAEVAGAYAGGATVAAVEAATDRYLADPSVRELDAAIGHEPRFTTESLLTCERAIVDGAERRRNEQTATLPSDAVARAIDRYQPVLNDGQAAAIHALTRAGHGVEVVSALAGTGKTTMIAALAQAYQDHGYRVIGTAPTARAARERRSAAGVPAGTMHALLAELDRAGQVQGADGAGDRRSRHDAHPPCGRDLRPCRAVANQDHRRRRSRATGVGASRWLAGRPGRPSSGPAAA